jgi:hypothetical protein
MIKILVLLGFKAIVTLLFLPVLNCWTASFHVIIAIGSYGPRRYGRKYLSYTEEEILRKKN